MYFIRQSKKSLGLTIKIHTRSCLQNEIMKKNMQPRSICLVALLLFATVAHLCLASGPIKVPDITEHSWKEKYDKCMTRADTSFCANFKVRTPEEVADFKSSYTTLYRMVHAEIDKYTFARSCMVNESAHFDAFLLHAFGMVKSVNRLATLLTNYNPANATNVKMMNDLKQWTNFAGYYNHVSAEKTLATVCRLAEIALDRVDDLTPAERSRLIKIFKRVKVSKRLEENWARLGMVKKATAYCMEQDRLWGLIGIEFLEVRLPEHIPAFLEKVNEIEKDDVLEGIIRQYPQCIKVNK